LIFLAEVKGFHWSGGYDNGELSHRQLIDSAISYIIGINDNHLGRPSKAIAWTDEALRRVDAKLEELDEALAAATTVAPVEVKAEPWLDALLGEQQVEAQEVLA
jgi:hypothetical protein